MINRSLQLKILNELNLSYPVRIGPESMECNTEKDVFERNLFYLHEHGLLEGIEHKEPGMDGILTDVKITANGLDFLADDGGLSAILNKITIKFDEEDLNALILSRIEQSNATSKQKSELITALKALPSETVKNVYTRLINFGLDNAPDAFRLMQKLMEQSV